MDQASKAAETDAAERSVAPPEVATDGDGAPAAPKPRRRRRGGRGRGGRSSSAGIRNGDAAPAGDDDAASPVEAGPAEARAEDSTGPSDRAVSADGSTATDGDGAPKPSSSSSRRRRRGGRGRGGGRSGASAAKVAANVAEGE
ncbi:MAG TPA: hypothetical protein VF044_09585, partial [Actinomycetota bacterium]